MDGKYIILFDGVCNLCNTLVKFVIRHDKKDAFRFASLQSEAGEHFLSQFNLPLKTDSFVLIENDKAYIRSTGALRVARHLSGALPLLYVFIIIPAPLRNLIYSFIAKHRYKWFGKQESCLLPSTALNNKFL